MLNSNKVKLNIVVFLLAIFAVSCSQEENGELQINDETIVMEAQVEESQTEEKNKNSIAKEKYIQEDVEDNFEINAQIILPKLNAYPIYPIKQKKFSEQDAAFFFNEESGDITKEVDPNNPNPDDSIGFTLNTSKGSSMKSNMGWLTYSRNAVRDNEIASIIQSYIFHDKANTNEELSFIDSKEAIRIGQEKIKLVTGEHAEVIQLVAMDSSTLSDYQEELIQDGFFIKKANINEWSEDDDIYYIQYSIIREELPLFYRSSKSNESGISMQIDAHWSFNTSVTIMIDKEGICYFDYENAFTDIQGEKEPQTIISPEEAINKVKEIYSDIILTDKHSVTKVYLEYIPVPDWEDISKIELRPYWCVQMEILSEQGDIWITAERINAVTGGNLSYGE